MKEGSKKRKVKRTRLGGMRVSLPIGLTPGQIVNPIKNLLKRMILSVEVLILAMIFVTYSAVHLIFFSLGFEFEPTSRASYSIAIATVAFVFVFAGCVKVFLAFRTNLLVLLMNKVKEKEKRFFDEINKGVSSLLTEKPK